MQATPYYETALSAPNSSPSSSVQLGTTAIGVRSKEGVVLVVEKRVTSPLLVSLCDISPHTEAQVVHALIEMRPFLFCHCCPSKEHTLSLQCHCRSPQA